MSFWGIPNEKSQILQSCGSEIIFIEFTFFTIFRLSSRILCKFIFKILFTIIIKLKICMSMFVMFCVVSVLKLLHRIYFLMKNFIALICFMFYIMLSCMKWRKLHAIYFNRSKTHLDFVFRHNSFFVSNVHLFLFLTHISVGSICNSFFFFCIGD